MPLLWDKFHYRANINCLTDTSIRSYDIRKANISILREANHISEEEYQWLYNADRMTRQVYIGKLLGRKPELSAALADGIKAAKKKFFEMNNLEDSEILEIDNDAIYVIGRRPIRFQQVSPYVFFKLEEEYTAYYRLKKISYFYSYNHITRTENLRAKGLGESGTALHEPFMLDFLKELFKTAQMSGYGKAIQLLAIFYKNYITRSLPIEYYRELNSQSMYTITIDGNSYSTDITMRNYINIVDISYNENILRELNKLLSILYLKKGF